MAGRIERDSATEDEWARATRIARVLLPLVEAKTRRGHVAAAAGELGISVASAYTYLARLKLDPRATAILGNRRGRATGYRGLDERVEQIISDMLETFYCSNQKPTEAAVVERIRNQCHKAELEPPSRKAIRTRIQAIDLHKRILAREGPDAAERALARPGRLVATRPNQIWLIDHTLADVILVDRRYRLPIGRPTITLIIDAYTRMCVGCYVSLGAPSIIQTAMALLRAFMPKEAWLEDAGVTWEWPAHGLPEIVHSDNGKDFRSLAIKRGLGSYNIDHAFRPVRRPRYGALIERFIGTVMGEVHLLPGTTFSNVEQRGDYDSDRRAVMTLDAFEQWLLLQIARYHRSPHRGIDGFTPLARWADAGFQPRAVPVGHAEDLLLAFLPSAQRQISRTGISFKSLRYWATWFAPLVRKGEGKLEIRYDPRDMSYIWGLSPTGWERVHLYDRRPPFTLREHELAIAELRSLAKAGYREADIHAIRDQTDDLIRAEADASRKARRRGEHAERSIEASRVDMSADLEDHGSPFTTPDPNRTKPVVEEW